MKLLTLIVLMAGIAAAQTATFTFAGLPSPFSQNQGRCTSITSWNGVSNAYPQDMGGICLDIYPAVYTDITIPWQLGFPNGGFLESGSTSWQPLVNNGDGTATQQFTATNFYDGGNTTIAATVNYQLVTETMCGRGGCHKFSAWQVVGGSGTVSND